MGTDLLPFDEVAALIATASAIGILLLTPLYFSQRRDVQRLREWMLKNPEHATSDLALSESRLDKTEVELERIYAERGEPVPGTDEQPATEVHPGIAAAAARVTSERPALERITMERAALEPHQQLRRFGSVATQPRWLAAIAVAALAIAVAAIVVVQQGLLSDDDNGAVAVNPSGIEVAVLNTTDADGLAGRISRQIEDSGFLPGDVQSFVRDVDQTVVMYQRGEARAAKRVARELADGGSAPAVQEIDREVQRAVPNADVVVILGQDRVAE
jgi:LytR cell envelope-related transcriptional attenuator